jgi:hypothetical protein
MSDQNMSLEDFKRKIAPNGLAADEALLIAAVMVGANSENDKTAGDIKNTMKRSFDRSGYELRKVTDNVRTK